MTEPQPVAVHLQEARAQLEARAAAVPPPVGDFDLVEERRQGMAELHQARWMRMVPSRFLHAQVTDFVAPVAAELGSWADASSGRNLVLFGPVGTGKSHAAVAACRSSVWQGMDLLFMPTVELLDLLDWRRPDSHQVLRDCCEVDRLILDDLGAERANEWTGERLYALINRRWLEERPTVATSNLAPEGLAEVMGERTYSRLVGSDALAVRLTGEDRRRAR